MRGGARRESAQCHHFAHARHTLLRAIELQDLLFVRIFHIIQDIEQLFDILVFPRGELLP